MQTSGSDRIENDGSGRMQARRDLRMQTFQQQRVRVRNLVLYSMEEPSEGDDDDTEVMSSYRVGPVRNESGQRAASHGINNDSRSRKSFSLAPSARDNMLGSSNSKASIDCRDESVSQSASHHTLAEIKDCEASAPIERDSLGSISYCEGEKVDDFRFGVHIDREQCDRACEIPLLSTQRPYMRAFHVSAVTCWL